MNFMVPVHTDPVSIGVQSRPPLALVNQPRMKESAQEAKLPQILPQQVELNVCLAEV